MGVENPLKYCEDTKAAKTQEIQKQLTDTTKPALSTSVFGSCDPITVNGWAGAANTRLIYDIKNSSSPGTSFLIVKNFTFYKDKADYPLLMFVLAGDFKGQSSLDYLKQTPTPKLNAELQKVLADLLASKVNPEVSQALKVTDTIVSTLQSSGALVTPILKPTPSK